MPSEEEILIARTYRLKSDESILAAKASLKKAGHEQPRAACNRAYYSVMQILTAAGYERLIDAGFPYPSAHPDHPKEGPNWGHQVYPELMSAFLRICVGSLDAETISLPQDVDKLRRYRNKADYRHPDKIPVSEAETMIVRAEKIRELVYGVIGRQLL